MMTLLVIYLILGYAIATWAVLHYSRYNPEDKGIVFAGFLLILFVWPFALPFFLSDVRDDRARGKK